MKEYGVFVSVLCAACFWSCQLMIEQPVYTESTNQKVAVTSMNKWEKHEFESEASFQHIEVNLYDIYNSEQLDILPLINDRCKGDLWKWSCTIDEFQHYLLTQIDSEEWVVFENKKSHKMFELIIDEKGKVIDVFTLLQKSENCRSCEEVLRSTIMTMPKWSPGVKDGRAVKTRLLIPFSLNSFS